MLVKLNRESYRSHSCTRKSGGLRLLKRPIHVRLPRNFFLCFEDEFAKALALTRV